MSDHELAPVPAGTWDGRPRWRCPCCARDSLDAEAIAEHLRLVHQPEESPEQPEEPPERHPVTDRRRHAGRIKPESPPVTAEEEANAEDNATEGQ